MSFFCLRGGKREFPFPDNLLTKEMWEDRYFLPGIIHGTPSYLIRIYLNDAHGESVRDHDHNQFEVEYLDADMICEAAKLYPDYIGKDADGFHEYICENLESFGVTSMDNDFEELIKSWPQSTIMSDEDLVKWARLVNS